MGLAAAMVLVFIPGQLLGESAVHTISLDATDSEPTINVPMGTPVTFENNYPQVLYETSVQKIGSDKNIINIASFPSGQSFGLEFMAKGPYSVCYRLKPKGDSTEQICLQINVVSLQTA